MNRFIYTCIITVFLFVPALSFAAPPLVPCDVGCQACDLVKLANNIIKWLIIVMVVGGAVIFAIAGLMMATSAGDVGKVTKAKGIFSNVVIGLIILLASWLIVDTVLKGLLKGGDGVIEDFGPWNDIKCVAPVVSVAPPVSAGDDTASHSDNLAYISPVTVSSSGGCSDKTVATCTSLDGMSTAALDSIKNFYDVCDCTVVVTGGTEVGHAGGTHSHGSGDKYDISLNADVDSYVTTNFRYEGVRGDGAPLYRDTSTGDLWAKESSHWDVLAL